ncbi:hypothetical protein JD508_01380 [Aeromonas jandaei]|uniref:hypothetical protein n=1 Tax=Aeromonas jandaei TaxID=650 RepID=UPI00191FF5FC|nr:hypothetical protein [Aeromonas jandaei]MBL0608935.1 hypothetical protein [Aeromonas jandaei]
MRLIDKVKLGLVALVVSLTLLCSINVMEGPRLPDQQQTQSLSQASESDDGVIKFVATNQNHLLRFEQSLRSDNQSKNVVYELIQSWSAQAILLVLLGWLLLAAQLYHKQRFRDPFATIHRHRLQRQYLQYRFTQSYLSA